MLRLKFMMILLILTSAADNFYAQKNSSIQINGGFISPMNSSEGLTGMVQFNYAINPKIDLYIYTGYSKWDKNHITFKKDFSQIQHKQFFTTYSEDDHTLIPFYIGGKIHFNENKYFKSFFNVELGYIHLSYNSYDNWESANPNTGEVLGYYADGSTKTKNNENLFGFGVGLGLSHPMSDELDLIIAFKLNTYVNSHYLGLFSSRGTYTLFVGGFNFHI